MNVGVALVAAALGVAAPMQCGSGGKEPELRLEDDPGDALWDLASTFEREGNAAARDRTLRYLVEKYPSNRHASDAKSRLGRP